jgi:hypothetical protein
MCFMAAPPKLDPELALLREDLAALPLQVRKEREARLTAMVAKEASKPIPADPLAPLLQIRILSQRHESAKK